MKKVMWWALGVVAVLMLIGALAGNEEKSPTSKDKAATGGTVSEEVAREEVAQEETPEPTPEPLNVNVTGPQETTSDQVKLKGRIAVKGAKVKVNGQRATVNGRFWSFPVKTSGAGDHRYKVVAIKAGHKTDRTTAVVTRNLSAAEKAVIRQERAAARANARALESAESYLGHSAFSKQGLYEQLSSSYGEGFTEAEAQYAVDHVGADWNKEAVESARSYLSHSSFSKQNLIEQLSSSYGEGFTYEQALYAVNKVY